LAVRRVASEMCDTGPHLTDSIITATHAQDAGECEQTKQEVLNSKSEADFARAEKKVNILCR
jgi:hypothetical protein